MKKRPDVGCSIQSAPYNNVLADDMIVNVPTPSDGTKTLTAAEMLYQNAPYYMRDLRAFRFEKLRLHGTALVHDHRHRLTPLTKPTCIELAKRRIC